MPNVGTSRVLLLGTENADSTVTGVTTGTSQPIEQAGAGVLSIFLRSVGATTGGTVLIEEADWGALEQPYSGTWSVIKTILASSFTGGAQVATHVSNSAYGYVRVRISSTITGGGTIIASLRSQAGA
jgi:hypothetical protein